MKNYFFVITLCFMSLTLNAFEYHGLKSGMSKEEVQSILKCEYSSSCSFGDDDDPEDTEKLCQYYFKTCNLYVIFLVWSWAPFGSIAVM